MPKSQQLQIRVSAEEKAQIQQRATDAGMDVSKWVLRQVIPPAEEEFQALCRSLVTVPEDRAYTFAALNDFFARLKGREFIRAISRRPDTKLPAFEANYLAAMIEYAASKNAVPVPRWVESIEPLNMPWFASPLKSLRLYLLTNSPAAFRHRNLFIDSTIGDRI